MASLFGAPLSVVTVGLASFDDAIAGAGARVTRVQWSPPGGEPATARALARLVGDPAVDAANKKAFDAYLASNAPLLSPVEGLFQGPVADALNHVGQINMLRRMAGSPVKGENYFKARILAGHVGAEQSAPRVEFD